MYEILFSETAFKHLKKLQKHIQKRIISVLERIRVRPCAFLRKLAGFPYFRLRVGDYRVIIDVRKKQLIVFVIEIGHRKKIYKRLK